MRQGTLEIQHCSAGLPGGGQHAVILSRQEQARYTQFKKALTRGDQRGLAQLFIYAKIHAAEAAQKMTVLPFQQPFTLYPFFSLSNLHV
jgi:hypothetical protein